MRAWAVLLVLGLAWGQTIPELRAQSYGQGGFRWEGALGGGAGFRRLLFSYLSDGLRVYGFANLPLRPGPRPVVLVLHGYVEPSRYRTLAYTARYADRLAQLGYLVLHPNYRGHPPSEGRPAQGLRHPYAVDVLHLLAEVRKGAIPQADPQRIALFGHSMGGGVAQIVATVDRGLRGVVLYGSMSGDEALNLRRIQFWSGGRRGRELETLPTETLALYSAWSFLKDISTPFSIHHGLQDAQVPPEWSWELCRRLKALGKPVECFSYPGGHLFRGQVEEVFLGRVEAFLGRVLR